MATDTQKYAAKARAEREARHSALAEFSRDERRPAVLLLSALMLSALFFGIGLMVGRWTAEPGSRSNPVSVSAPSTTSTPAPTPQPVPTAPVTNAATETQPDIPRRYSVLVATYDAPEKAQSLIKFLEEAGYSDVRDNVPRPGESPRRYSVLVGRFTQDEASETVRKLRSTKNPRLKNAKVIEVGL